MQTSPTLSKNEFSDVHNAKCKLYSLLQKLNGVVHSSIQQELEEAISLFERGLESAYKAEDEAADAAEAAADRVKKNLKLKNSVWAMPEVLFFDEPHRWPGRDTLRYCTLWGSSDVVVKINGPTWADLWVAADAAIRLSGDDHHVFIEDFDESTTNSSELILQTGS